MPTWKTTLRSTHNYFARFWTDAPTQCLAPATCYKVIRADLLNSIPIRSDRFGFEPEIVMKSAERTLRIYEVPIRYHGRAYEKGKTISWKVGIKALA